MKEIEVKILNVNGSEIERKLKKLKAKKVFSGAVHAVYYEDAKKSLRKKGSVIRLRSIGKKTELVYKAHRKHKSAKVAIEREVLISDFRTGRMILEEIGLKPIREMKKKRVSYQKGKLHFELDTYAGLPTLLEIESPTMKGLREALKMLGYSLKQTVPWNAFQVQEHYRKK